MEIIEFVFIIFQIIPIRYQELESRIFSSKK